MNLIIPMAGIGKRLRPHTLLVPKPLFRINGQPIVERLVKDISALVKQNFENIGFVIGNFSDSIKQNLLELANSLGAKGKLFIQNQALGTAHAIYQAKDLLNGPTIIAFADTLFEANFSLNQQADAVIWTKKVNNPANYGVVKINEESFITDFIEKPKEFVSDLAIIGIYYFKNAEELKNKIEFIISNDMKVKGEYQLTDALKLMLDDGKTFVAQTVDQWYDCGNKKLILQTTINILEKEKNFKAKNVLDQNSIINGNYYIADNVKLVNSILKNNVSIEQNAVIEDCILENVIVQRNAHLKGLYLKNSIIGENATINNKPKDFDLGSFSTLDL